MTLRPVGRRSVLLGSVGALTTGTLTSCATKGKT
jgi:hypothetical protein